jgi:hypothetical protein
MTIAQLREIEKTNPQMPQFVHRLTCTSYQQFVDTLYVQIDTIVNSLVRDANVLQGDAYSENALNADICRQLRCLGYDAHHDKNSRGHTDISVEYGRFSWIGEGKKVLSVNNTHLRNGYDQLVHRYVAGTVGAEHAGLLIYSYAPDAKHILQKWRDHLSDIDVANPGYAEKITSVTANEGFAFWSTNQHSSSGSALMIKHIVLSLHWAPPK